MWINDYLQMFSINKIKQKIVSKLNHKFLFSINSFLWMLNDNTFLEIICAFDSD